MAIVPSSALAPGPLPPAEDRGYGPLVAPAGRLPQNMSNSVEALLAQHLYEVGQALTLYLF